MNQAQGIVNPNPNQKITFIFDQESVKDFLTDISNDLVDKTVDAAKPILKNGAEKTIEVTVAIGGSCIKNNVVPKAPTVVQSVLNAAVDASEKECGDCCKQALPQGLDKSLETTATVTKSVLKTSIDHCVSGSHTVLERVVSMIY